MTRQTHQNTPSALITGASRGLGLALATALAERGWDLVVDARDADALGRTSRQLGSRAIAITGDVTDPAHRDALLVAVRELGHLDLLVNNASTLGASPLPLLVDLTPEDMRRILETNVVAPFALIRGLAPYLSGPRATVVNLTSDAAIEPYETWGGYGASKAALDQLTAVFAAERPSLAAYAFDPGDMRTQMHQDAFPGEDISDRPKPDSVVPTLLHLIDQRPTSGRYRAADPGLREQEGVR